jgi:hypothetical protein
MRGGFLGDLTMLIAVVLIIGVMVIGIGSIGSSPVIGPNGLSWDHAGRIAHEQQRTERERIEQAAETKRAREREETMRWLIVALVAGGGIWIATREMGATVRNRDDNRAKVAMYQIYMREQYPNARIETRNNQQLVVDPDTRTVFPLAVLRAEARQAGYEEI